MATKKTKTKDERVAEFRKEMRRVRDRERRFRKMTPAQKRMAVARDVISQVAARKIRPKSGAWMDTTVSTRRTPLEVTEETQLQEVLASQKCTACAVGALFACTVLRQDDLPIGDLVDFDFVDSQTLWDGLDVDVGGFKSCARYMDGIFDEEQLLLMEAAFEQGGTQSQYNVEGYRDAVSFGYRFETDRERMLAIMENILENKGQFVPPTQDPHTCHAEQDEYCDECAHG